jgi:hypothetical protein
LVAAVVAPLLVTTALTVEVNTTEPLLWGDPVNGAVVPTLLLDDGIMVSVPFEPNWIVTYIALLVGAAFGPGAFRYQFPRKDAAHGGVVVAAVAVGATLYSVVVCGAAPAVDVPVAVK